MTTQRGFSDLWQSVLALPLWQGIRARMVWLLATGFLAVVAGVSGILAWEYTNSTTFCGTQCHTMPPEYAAYTRSLHARVSCVDCHIGRVGFFKTAWLKSGHGGHLTSLVFDNYERPIRIKSLRPARETCELCHWPEAFYEDRVQEIRHYAPDEGNSLSTTFLIMRTGGGLSREGRGRGIHWHIENEVEFVATDKEELEIPWVRVTDSRGEVTEYVDSSQGWSPDMLDESAVQVMECLDCHNRNAHLFRSPDSSLDEALRTGQIDASLPFIKAKGLELLQAEYTSLDEARAAIRGLVDDYRENYAQVYEAKAGAVQQAVRTMTQILEETVFPNQAVGWSTYPDHQGHKDFPGCFRCHDGKHRSEQGESIRLHCNICHSIPVVLQPGEETKVEELGKRLLVAEEPPSHLASNFVADHRFQAGESCESCHGPIEFGSDDSSFCSNSACHEMEWPEVQLDAEQVHPMPLKGRHAELWCQDCHKDERKPDNACASCHQRPHEWGDETCDTCHLLDGWIPARSG